MVHGKLCEYSVLVRGASIITLTHNFIGCIVIVGSGQDQGFSPTTNVECFNIITETCCISLFNISGRIFVDFKIIKITVRES